MICEHKECRVLETWTDETTSARLTQHREACVVCGLEIIVTEWPVIIEDVRVC